MSHADTIKTRNTRGPQDAGAGYINALAQMRSSNIESVLVTMADPPRLSSVSE